MVFLKELGTTHITAKQGSEFLTWRRNVSTRRKSVPLLFWYKESGSVSVNISYVFTILAQELLEYITIMTAIS
jgi:hypothetical protein